MTISKSQIFLFLILIGIASLGLKLYLTDFSVPPPQDTFGYVLRGIAHTNGDFTEPPRKTLGWSLFVSPFLSLINSENFLDYVNVVRILGLIVSLFTIFPMYLLSRKFFNEKYSIVAASLFAFIPYLNYNSGQGLSEPLYILTFIVAFYFILHKNPNFAFLSFAVSGIAWWIRWPGIVLVFVLTIIFFLNNRKNPTLFLKYLGCITIFLIIVSPMLLNRYEEYGDPLFFSMSSHIFSGDYGTFLASNTQNSEYTAFDFINQYGIGEFIYKFIFTGSFNLFEQLIKISFPYLIILIPFGILFSFRAFDQEKKYIRSNWILIIITLLASIITFSIIPERRFLFFIFPFLIIFSVIPIQRLIEYGMSTFSFSTKQKNIVLFLIILVIFIMGSLFMTRFDTNDSQLEYEKMQLAQQLSALDGIFLVNNEDWQYSTIVALNNNPESFQKLSTTYENGRTILPDNYLPLVTIYATSLSDLLLVSQDYELEYIVIHNTQSSPWYSYLDDVYDNDQLYPYLEKIIDTKNEGYQKLETKVFKINYEE